MSACPCCRNFAEDLRLDRHRNPRPPDCSVRFLRHGVLHVAASGHLCGADRAAAVGGASAPQVWPITYLWKIEDIDAAAYKERLETARMRMRAQQGESYDAKAFESVENKRKILDTLIDDRLMQLATKRDNIVIGDAQVAEAIGKIPDFQVDGAFNTDRYQMLLSTQNPPMTPRSFEAKVRDGLMDDLIPSRIAQSAFVTDTELDRLMRLLGEHRDVSYVNLPAPAADTSEVTQAQIDAWYKAHAAQFHARKPCAWNMSKWMAASWPHPWSTMRPCIRSIKSRLRNRLRRQA